MKEGSKSATQRNYSKKSPALQGVKSAVDRLDINRLEITPVHLSKINEIVKNEVVIKFVYDEQVEKVNPLQKTDTSKFVKKQSTMQKLKILKIKLLIVINVLLLLKLINFWVKYLRKN